MQKTGFLSVRPKVTDSVSVRHTKYNVQSTPENQSFTKENDPCTSKSKAVIRTLRND